MTERKDHSVPALRKRRAYSTPYETTNPLLRYTLQIVGGDTFTGLTEEEMRKQLKRIDPQNQMMRGRDYDYEAQETK